MNDSVMASGAENLATEVGNLLGQQMKVDGRCKEEISDLYNDGKDVITGTTGQLADEVRDVYNEFKDATSDARLLHSWAVRG